MSMPSLPDAGRHFGEYGGKFVPETLMSPLEELEKAYQQAGQDPRFQQEFEQGLRRYVGRSCFEAFHTVHICHEAGLKRVAPGTRSSGV